MHGNILQKDSSELTEKGCWKKQRVELHHRFLSPSGDSARGHKFISSSTPTGPGSNSLKRTFPLESSEAHKKARVEREGESMDVPMVDGNIQDDVKTGGAELSLVV